MHEQRWLRVGNGRRLLLRNRHPNLRANYNERIERVHKPGRLRLGRRWRELLRHVERNLQQQDHNRDLHGPGGLQLGCGELFGHSERDVQRNHH